MYDLTIILPTYNEKANLVKLLPAIQEQFRKLKIRGGILVVDDNSPDGSGDYVESQIPKLSNPGFFLELLRRPRKQGLGVAYTAGYNKVLAADNTKFILCMDADFSHDPKYIPDIYRALQENDMVIGSRYIKGGGTENWNWSRRTISKMALIYSKLLLWWPVNDGTTAYVGFRTSSLKQIPYGQIKAVHYGYMIELKYLGYKKHFRIKEVPIIFADRVAGKTKFNKRIFLEGIFNTLQLRFRYRNFK